MQTRILCDRILANLAWPGVAARLERKSREELELGWSQCTRRALRAVSSTGRHVGILLPLGITPRHDDLLFEDDASYLVVVQLPSEVWAVRATSMANLATVALELGNLHVPVEVSPDGTLYTPPDGPTERVLRRAGAVYELCERRFQPLRATVTSAVSVAKNLAVTSRAVQSGS